MEKTEHRKLLESFYVEKVPTRGKGNLSVLLLVTEEARKDSFPLVFNDYLTPERGQVACLSGPNLKALLAKHGENRKLAAEAGRTSRGSLALTEAYIDFLNGLNERFSGNVDFDIIMDFWMEKVRDYFDAKPLVLNNDSAKSVQCCFSELFEEVKKRQREKRGTQYVGTVLQHLVEAKLFVLNPDFNWVFHGANVADDQTGRAGDIEVGEVSIHCTSSPSPALADKCKSNIDAGLRPVIVTMLDRVDMAKAHLSDIGMSHRVEVWSVEQFLAANAFEISLREESDSRAVLARIVDVYNGIVREYETDKNLLIELK